MFSVPHIIIVIYIVMLYCYAFLSQLSLQYKNIPQIHNSFCVQTKHPGQIVKFYFIHDIYIFSPLLISLLYFPLVTSLKYNIWFDLFYRFNCGICMCPRLKMVYGSCQHRICVDCLYSNLDVRRPSMQKCPTCQKIDAFPLFR